jgi:DHA2 family multidrug resistance protein
LGFGLLASGFGSLEFVLDKGQEDDWFGSHVILFFIILCVASLVTLLVWELYQLKINKRPIINLTLFKRKTFTIPFVFMFVLGFMFYSTLVLIPKYVQTLLGYSAVLAGEVISPGGFALLLTMPLVGFLITKVDARWLLCFGVFTLSTSLVLMHTISLESSFRYIMWIRIYQMAGLSFFFIPINTIAYLGVAKSENNDVSGLINLSRNIGGSVGTAFIGTTLARASQRHQTYMVSHVTPTSLGFIAQMARLKPLFHGNVRAAQAYIYNELLRQSAMLAYLDIIAVIAVMCGLIGPLVFLLGKMEPPKDGPAMH